MSKSASESASKSVSEQVSISRVATAGASALSLASLTELLEALGRPTLPPVPDELARLVSEYLEAGLTLHGLRDARPLLQRCAPQVADWLAKILNNKKGGHSLEGAWADHPGVPVAITLVAVWMTAVAEPLRSSPARPTRSPGHQEVGSDYLDQWIEALLPVARYLEPILAAEPRPSRSQVVEKLGKKQWVAKWIGEAEDSALVKRITDHVPTTIGSSSISTYDRWRRRGIKRLYDGIRTVLGEGPLPTGYITRVLPGIAVTPEDVPDTRVGEAVVFVPRPGPAGGAERALADPAEQARQAYEWLSDDLKIALHQLVAGTQEDGPFGEAYAMAVWNLTRPEARRRLDTLVRVGVLARLSPVIGSPTAAMARWQVAPEVVRLVRERAPAPASWIAVLRRELGALWLAERLQRLGGSLRHVPWQFYVVATLWWFGWGTFKLVGEALLWLVDRVRGDGRLLGRWQMGTVPLLAVEHLQARWQALGETPLREVRLLYSAGTQQGVRGRL